MYSNMNGLKIVVQQRTEHFAYTKTLQKSSVLDYIHYNKKLKTKLGCMKKYKLAMFVLSLVILAGIITSRPEGFCRKSILPMLNAIFFFSKRNFGLNHKLKLTTFGAILLCVCQLRIRKCR